MANVQSRVLGCLMGCAVGDALGAPFEGYWDHQLPRKSVLMARFAEVEGYPRGQYTDDTQLTLATVESIVGRDRLDPVDIALAIATLWKNHSVVGPGGSCTFAANAFLKTGDWTTCGAPVGQAGNGTAMRTAAIGLYFLRDPEQLSSDVALVSRITHHDPRSVAGGVAIAKAAQWLATTEAINEVVFCEAMADAMLPFDAAFAALVEQLPIRLGEDRDTAIHAIAWAGSPKPEFSRPIITPFVVPTVLASLWIVLRNPNSWEDAVAEAIHLGGDVDTLGAIVGALMGARLGIESIPKHLTESVLNSEKIRILAHRYALLIEASGL